MVKTDAASVRSSIRKYILENYLFSDDDTLLSDSASLRDSGAIDSMGMVELIYYIETEFQFKVLDTDMVPEKLDSVDRLVSYVLSRKEC